jgi:hypothetical protein
MDPEVKKLLSQFDPQMRALLDEMQPTRNGLIIALSVTRLIRMPEIRELQVTNREVMEALAMLAGWQIGALSLDGQLKAIADLGEHALRTARCFNSFAETVKTNKT